MPFGQAREWPGMRSRPVKAMKIFMFFTIFLGIVLAPVRPLINDFFKNKKKPRTRDTVETNSNPRGSGIHIPLLPPPLHPQIPADRPHRGQADPSGHDHQSSHLPTHPVQRHHRQKGVGLVWGKDLNHIQHLPLSVSTAVLICSREKHFFRSDRPCTPPIISCSDGLLPPVSIF